MRNGRVLHYARSHQSRFVHELAEFVRFATVGAKMEHAGDMKKCADWLAQHLEKIGLDFVEVISTSRHPIVYAQWLNQPGRPTVLIYGHYDVQPADPLQEWKSPPFQPVVRGANLYGRGSSDDKGQMFTHIKALECYLQTLGELPVNVKCLFEGEEEIGSPSLITLLSQPGWNGSADVAVVSDMPMLGIGRPAITYALRGMLCLELEVDGPQNDLHSGIYGGTVCNPLQAVCEMMGRLHHPDGRIAIPGFYDRVRLWSEAERDFMARTGPTDSEILRNAQVIQGWGESQFTLYERTTIRPSLSINGIGGGYQGDGPKAVIPARVKAKLSFRLVPDQDSKEIDRLVRQYLADILPAAVRISVKTQSSARPTVLHRNHPAMMAAGQAYRLGFGASPVFLRSGGTIPVVDILQNSLGISTVIMGFALPDDRMHGPNEKFYLPNFINGVSTSIHFLSEIGLRLKSAYHSHGLETSQAGMGVLL